MALRLHAAPVATRCGWEKPLSCHVIKKNLVRFVRVFEKVRFSIGSNFTHFFSTGLISLQTRACKYFHTFFHTIFLSYPFLPFLSLFLLDFFRRRRDGGWGEENA
jgi:hypothetical protein